MKRSRLISAVIVWAASSAAMLRAQEPTFKFVSGEWQVGSDVTTPDGRTTHSSLGICANSSRDLFERPHPGEQCEAPVITSLSSGVRVQTSCHGGQGTVTFTKTSDVEQIFGPDGMSFTGNGTSTTTTTVAGKTPMRSTTTTASSGRNIGACPKSK